MIQIHTKCEVIITENSFGVVTIFIIFLSIKLTFHKNNIPIQILNTGKKNQIIAILMQTKFVVSLEIYCKSIVAKTSFMGFFCMRLHLSMKLG